MVDEIKSKVLGKGFNSYKVGCNCLPGTSNLSKLVNKVKTVLSNIFTFLYDEKSVYVSHNLYDDTDNLRERNYYVFTQKEYAELEKKCARVIPGGFEIEKDRFGMAFLIESTSAKSSKFRKDMRSINADIKKINASIKDKKLDEWFLSYDLKEIDINTEFNNLEKKKNSMGGYSVSEADIADLIETSKNRLKKIKLTNVRTSKSIQIDKRITTINDQIESFKKLIEISTFPKLAEIKGIKLQDVLDNSLSSIESELLNFKDNSLQIQNVVREKIREVDASPHKETIDQLTHDISSLSKEIKDLNMKKEKIDSDRKILKDQIFRLENARDLQTEQEEAEYISRAGQIATEKELKQDELTSYTNAIRDNKLSKKERKEYNEKVEALGSEIDKLELTMLSSKPIDRQKPIDEKKSRKTHLKAEFSYILNLISKKESEINLKSKKQKDLLDLLNIQFIPFVNKKIDELKAKIYTMNIKIENHNKKT